MPINQKLLLIMSTLAEWGMMKNRQGTDISTEVEG